MVLIEYQNDFTSEGGVLHGAVAAVMDKTDMLANTRRVAEAARAAGATVMQRRSPSPRATTRSAPTPTGSSRASSTASLRQGLLGRGHRRRSAPADGDIVIEGKRGLDTFASTNLDFILRSKGITTIALGGFLTNCCVESTMRTGYEHGYQVITLNDCIAATSLEEHDNALRYDYPMFSQPMDSDSFIAELGSDAAAVKALMPGRERQPAARRRQGCPRQGEPAAGQGRLGAGGEVGQHLAEQRPELERMARAAPAHHDRSRAVEHEILVRGHRVEARLGREAGRIQAGQPLAHESGGLFFQDRG